MKLLREALPDLSWWRTARLPTEAVAGVAGALLVIPQAITFAYLAGMASEYGLYCAVFVGLLASLLGNSPMVGGPNTAVSILIGLSVLPFAGRGSPLYVDYVLALSLMVGLIQLVIWLLRGADAPAHPSRAREAWRTVGGRAGGMKPPVRLVESTLLRCVTANAGAVVAAAAICMSCVSRAAGS